MNTFLIKLKNQPKEWGKIDAAIATSPALSIATATFSEKSNVLHEIGTFWLKWKVKRLF